MIAIAFEGDYQLHPALVLHEQIRWPPAGVHTWAAPSCRRRHAGLPVPQFAVQPGRRGGQSADRICRTAEVTGRNHLYTE
jgi:hypothetical protein